MEFTPLTQEELDAQMRSLAEGHGNFEVTSATEKTSAKNNPMIEVKLRVWDSTGHEGMLTDYLVSSAQWKIKQFCDAVGMENEYNAGQISAEHIIGKSGHCTIGTQPAREYNGKKYRESPKIVSYDVVKSVDAKHFYEKSAPNPPSNFEDDLADSFNNLDGPY